MLILLAVGSFMQRKFTFDLRGLSNILTYCLMPAAVFINIYKTKVDIDVLGELIGFIFLFSTILMVISMLLSKLLGLNKDQSAVFKNSIVLMNSGNYGMPISQLVFSANPLGLSIQIIMLIYQNLLTFTYGLYNLVSATKSGLDILRDLLRLPIIHAVLLGAALNLFNVPIPHFLWLPLEHLSDAFVAIALIALGAQLAQIRMKTIFNKVILASSFGRLIMGPLIALLLIYILGLDGVVAQSLFIASSFPTSRNSATLALEYDVEPNLAAQIVLFTTVMSSLTVGLVIYFSTILFT